MVFAVLVRFARDLFALLGRLVVNLPAGTFDALSDEGAACFRDCHFVWVIESRLQDTSWSTCFRGGQNPLADRQCNAPSV